MNDFEFDFSDKALTDTGIKIEMPVTVEKVVKKINKISDLTKEQKSDINNILWYKKEITNSNLVDLFIEEFGLSEVIANNLVHIHRPAYIASKGHYTIFDREKKISTFTKSSMKFFNTKYQYV
jgi:hypothetical protein